MPGCNAGRERGFTLLELAVVVMVVTLLLGSLLVPLATQVEQRNVSETQKRLQEIKEALIGFAMANGRFPCPAGNQPGDKGIEKFAGVPASGNCTNFFDGYVPGITLGLANLDDQGFVVDAWGLRQNRIRYAVTNQTVGGVAYAFTAQGQMKAVGAAALGASSLSGGVSLLYVCASSAGTTASNCGTAQTLTSDAVFVVYSLGKNAASSGGTSPDEALNVNLAKNPVFVSRTNSTTAGAEFDDIVLWTSRYNIVSQLIAAGQVQ